jgi:oxygen-independent coproporphyrinogen-3 oxidase
MTSSVEDGILFAERYSVDSLLLPDEDTEREMYHSAVGYLRSQGYNRYEISNFALPEHECVHNTLYWRRADYIGFGLGASSFIRNRKLSTFVGEGACEVSEELDPLPASIFGERYKNTPDIAEYVISAANKRESKTLTRQEAMEEYMFLGLRMDSGVSMTGFENQFGVSLRIVYGDVVDKMISAGCMQSVGDTLSLTCRGIDVSNVVLAEFLLS